jgi:hypothetical protein
MTVLATAAHGAELRDLRASYLELPANTPLTNALTRVAQSLSGGYVLYGIEIRLDAQGEEPRVNIRNSANQTFGMVLDDLGQQLQDYSFDIVNDHFVHIYPKAFPQNTNVLLSRRVAQFDFDGCWRTMGALLDLPEVRAVLTQTLVGNTERQVPCTVAGDWALLGATPPPMRALPQLHVHLRDVAVREILNAVTEAMVTTNGVPDVPAGWVYWFDPRMPSGATHTFNLVEAVPSNNWKTAVRMRTLENGPQREVVKALQADDWRARWKALGNLPGESERTPELNEFLVDVWQREWGAMASIPGQRTCLGCAGDPYLVERTFGVDYWDYYADILGQLAISAPKDKNAAWTLNQGIFSLAGYVGAALDRVSSGLRNQTIDLLWRWLTLFPDAAELPLQSMGRVGAITDIPRIEKIASDSKDGPTRKAANDAIAAIRNRSGQQ